MQFLETDLDYLIQNGFITLTKQLFAHMWIAIENSEAIVVTRAINGKAATIQIRDEETLADYKRYKVPLWMVQQWYA